MIKKQWLQLKYILGLGVLIIVLLKIGFFIEFIYHRLFNKPYDSLSAGIAEIIIQVAAFTVVIGVGLKDQHKKLSSVCLLKKVNGKVWVAAIILTIGFVLFNFYLNFLFYSFKYGWDTRFAVTQGNFFINLISNAVIPAVAEELIIKGLVFTILKKYYSTITAVIIASLMFAVLHLTPIRIIPLFLGSCFTFWIYLRSGSLILPIFEHFINNLFADVLISEPFNSLGTFYAALAMFVIGAYMMYMLNKVEKAKTINNEQLSINNEKMIQEKREK
jgi:membrane protease YdiL (CAAX protease family)